MVSLVKVGSRGHFLDVKQPFVLMVSIGELHDLLVLHSHSDLNEKSVTTRLFLDTLAVTNGKIHKHSVYLNICKVNAYKRYCSV